MANALDAVLQYKAQEAANQRAQGDSILMATQLFQQARQQAQDNKLKELLTNAQIRNYESDILKNSQSLAAQRQQNDLINKALNGSGTSGTNGWGVKSIKIGDVTLEKPPEPLNNGVPLTGIDSIQDPSMKNLVQGVLDYKIDPSKSTSLRGDQRQKLVEMAAAIDPTYDQTQFPARAQFRKALTSGNLSKGILASNTVIGHLDSLKKSFEELNKARFSNDIPAINDVENFALTHSGKGVVNAVKINADAVANELETLFRGTNGSLTGVEEFKKNLKLNSSPEQQKTIINKAIDLIASRVNAIDDLHNNTMGKPRDFSVLSNKSKEIIAGLGVDPNLVDPIGELNKEQVKPKISKEAAIAELKRRKKL